MHPPTSSQAPSSNFASFLTRIRSLAHRPQRDAQRRFFIEGLRNFIQAADARFPIDTIYYSPILLKGDLPDMLARRLHAQGVPRIRITPEQFRSISTTERASGIAAILHQRWFPIEHADPQRGLCWLVIEHIRFPGNLGSILRTAEACSAAGVIFVGHSCDPYDPAVVRASMGSLFHLPLVRTTARDLIRWARRHGVLLAGLAPRADLLWTELPTAAPIALIVGEERGGLSEELLGAAHTTVRLPMTGHADSLNVSVATGIMLYELFRHRLECGRRRT